jgi:hypothetical protein
LRTRHRKAIVASLQWIYRSKLKEQLVVLNCETAAEFVTEPFSLLFIVMNLIATFIPCKSEFRTKLFLK